MGNEGWKRCVCVCVCERALTYSEIVLDHHVAVNKLRGREVGLVQEVLRWAVLSDDHRLLGHHAEEKGQAPVRGELNTQAAAGRPSSISQRVRGGLCAMQMCHKHSVHSPRLHLSSPCPVPHRVLSAHDSHHTPPVWHLQPPLCIRLLPRRRLTTPPHTHTAHARVR